MKGTTIYTNEVTGMIFKYFAFVFFIVLFLFIAFAIVKDMTRERRLIDGKSKPRPAQSYNEHKNVYGSKVVPLKKRKRSTNKQRRGDR